MVKCKSFFEISGLLLWDPSGDYLSLFKKKNVSGDIYCLKKKMLVGIYLIRYVLSYIYLIGYN